MDTKENKKFNWKKASAIGLSVLAVGGVGYGLYNHFQVDNLSAEKLALNAQLQTKTTEVTKLVTEKVNLQNSLDTIQGNLVATQNSEKAANNQIASLKTTNEELLAKQAELDSKIKADIVAIDSEVKLEQSIVADDLLLNSFVPEKSLSNSKLAFLNEGTVYLDGESFDTKEVIFIPANTLEVKTSEGVPVLSEKSGMNKLLMFEDPVPVSTISASNPLSIDFFGKDIDIVKASADSVSISIGEGHSLAVGDSFVVGEKTIKLTAIGTDVVKIDISGTGVTLKENVKKSVGGLTLSAKDIITVPNSASGVSSATIQVDSETPRTLAFGDNWIKGNSEYAFRFGFADGKLEVFGFERVEGLLNKESLLKVGQSRKALDGAANLHFGWDVNPTEKKVSLSFDEFNRENVVEHVLKFKTEGKLLEVGTDEVSEAWVNAAGVVYYKDSRGQLLTAPGLIVVNDETKLPISVDGNKVNVGDIILSTKDMKQFGEKEKTAEDFEVKVGENLYGDSSTDVLLSNGVVIKTPKSSLENNELSLLVPDEKPTFKISFSRE